MYDLFKYNWQVRDDWFTWCENIGYEELTKARIGGMGSILRTLFHVIDCERLWINQLLGNPESAMDIDSITELDVVKSYSKETSLLTDMFFRDWHNKHIKRTLEIRTKSGSNLSFSYEKVILHIITHEIHHIGQLSIWAREMDIKPVNTDLLTRNYV